MKLLLALLFAAPLVISNSSEKGFRFIVTQTKPAMKKAVKIKLYKDDEYGTKFASTTKTKHRVEARDENGKRVACAMVSNASKVDLVLTPDNRYHFVCTGGDPTKSSVPCALSACAK